MRIMHILHSYDSVARTDAHSSAHTHTLNPAVALRFHPGDSYMGSLFLFTYENIVCKLNLPPMQNSNNVLARHSSAVSVLPLCNIRTSEPPLRCYGIVNLCTLRATPETPFDFLFQNFCIQTSFLFILPTQYFD